MNIERRMRREVITVQKDDCVDCAQTLMARNGIRHLPVLDGKRLVGVLSDRDVRGLMVRQRGVAGREGAGLACFLVPGVQGYAPDADRPVPHDREKARRLLAEAGYPEGFEVTLDAGNVQPAADVAQAVAVMLAQVGIRVRPNIVPQASYFPKIERHDTSFYVLSWGH